MTAPAWLLWPPVGRLVRDRNSGRTRREARSLSASSGRLLAEAAMHGPGGPTVGRTRRGHGPDDQHARRVLEVVVLVCPGTSPVWGVGWVSDRAAAKATKHLNVALTHLEEASRLAREAGLPGHARLGERLACEVTGALAELQPALEPTAPAGQAAMP